MADSLQRNVDIALDAAVFEQCYSALMFYGHRELAEYLCDYDPLIQGEDVDEVESRVAEYLKWYWNPDREQDKQRSEA